MVKSLEMNKVINVFIVSKKLTLSDKKCFQIHIGKGHKDCPKLSVHEKVMKEADTEKYLGDQIDKTDSINATKNGRHAKGLGIITGIMSILDEIPLGRHKMDKAMKLREVMLIMSLLMKIIFIEL